MAQAYKCDICGQFYDDRHRLKISEYRIAWLSNGSSDFSNMYYDICPDCMAAIQKAIDGRKKEGNNDQY